MFEYHQLSTDRIVLVFRSAAKARTSEDTEKMKAASDSLKQSQTQINEMLGIGKLMLL
jgi:hypothetical protein